MKSETIAIHGGYDVDPTTRAVAVPIYQTVAYAFDSADHGAALFNLEVEGFRYSRISNPTTAVLERRVAALEGGVDSLCVSSGQAALNYAVLNVTGLGTNIVSVPQLYGTTYTLFAHLLPSQGITVRFAESDQPAAIEALIDDDTRAVFCESVGNPAGNICDLEALARVAHQHGVHADPLEADRLWRRRRGAFLDEVHGRSRHHPRRHHRRRRALPLAGPRPPVPDVQRAGRLVSRPRLRQPFRGGRLHRALPQRLSADDRRRAVAPERVLVVAGHRDGGPAGRAPRGERPARRRIPARRSPGRVGQLRGLPGESLPRARPTLPRRPRLLPHDLRDQGRLRSRQEVLRRARARQAARQHGRRQIPRVPPRLDHPSTDVGRGATQGRGAARDDPPQRRHRAHRRHHRRPRSGPRRDGIRPRNAGGRLAVADPGEEL